MIAETANAVFVPNFSYNFSKADTILTSIISARVLKVDSSAITGASTSAWKVRVNGARKRCALHEESLVVAGSSEVRCTSELMCSGEQASHIRANCGAQCRCGVLHLAAWCSQPVIGPTYSELGGRRD